MSNDVVVKDETGASGFLAIIERVASNKDVDVSKLEKMLEMQERIMTKNAEMEFNRSMSDLQPLLPQIKKTAKAHNSKYAPYEEIDATVRPLYTKAGFSISFDSKKENGHCTYYGTISHREGHSRTAEIQLPDDDSGKKNAIQAVASTISYAKRYLICMLLNIVTADDDDGESGGAKYITDEQAKELKGLIRETGTDIAKFLVLIGGFPNIDEIPYGAYKTVHSMLIAKKQNRGKNAE